MNKSFSATSNKGEKCVLIISPRRLSVVIYYEGMIGTRSSYRQERHVKDNITEDSPYISHGDKNRPERTFAINALVNKELRENGYDVTLVNFNYIVSYITQNL